MAFGLSGGSLALARRGLVIAIGGGSNVLGTATGAPWVTKPGNVTYWTSKTGSLVNTGAWPTNPGIVVGLIDELVNVLGHSGAITVVEHGVAGTGYAGWATTNAAELIAHCATAGVRPTVVCEYLGSVDAKAGGVAVTNILANVQTTTERYRTAWGGGVAMLIGGCHIPESGVDAALDSVDTGMYTFAVSHKAALAQYVNNRTLAIQGGGSDHLTGGALPNGVTDWAVQPANGTAGGSDLAGRRMARALHASGVIL